MTPPRTRHGKQGRQQHSKAHRKLIPIPQAQLGVYTQQGAKQPTDSPPPQQVKNPPWEIVAICCQYCSRC